MHKIFVVLILLFTFCLASDDMGAIIDEAVNNNAVMVFSKSYCPYCKRAKSLLQNLKIAHHVIELDQIAHGRQLQQAVGDRTGKYTVPVIFIGREFIGGSDDLMQMFDNKNLFAMLDKKNISYEKQEKEEL